MKIDIINYCNNTRTIHGISDIFKENFLNDFKKLKPKQRPPVLNALPYIYRMWYYTTLIDDTSLSPANFINTQIREKNGGDSIVVPIASPIYKNNVLKDFKFEYKAFSLQCHPVLEDMKLLLQQCTPDIGIDESGIILEEERDKFINSLCFKEIFYVSFLTNIAYELKLLKKMPSINTYRAMPNVENLKAFLSLTEVEGLKMITDATFGIASKVLCNTFTLSEKTFSKESLINLFKNSQNLDEYLDDIFIKFNLDINIDLGDIENLENMEFNSIEDVDNLDIPSETLMALALKFELSFLIDAYLITPLGYYLQFIKPIYINEIDFKMSFEQLIQAYDSNIPLIKFFFIMGNGYDLTSLGTHFLSNGKSPKNEYQNFIHKINFKEAYDEIVNYNLDMELDLEDNDTPIPYTNKETITSKNKAYSFKVKHYSNKRSWKTFDLKGTQTLEDLASAIITSFELDYGHLYSFFMNNKFYDGDYEITCPYSNNDKHVTTKYKVCDLNLCQKQKFLFLYDFGEDIKFEVEFIESNPLEKEVKYPTLKNTSKDYKI